LDWVIGGESRVGQGAVRCHPQVLAEMNAVAARDAEALGNALLAHAAHVLRNLGRSVFGAAVQGTPPAALRGEAKAIARLSAQFALSADLAMGLLGGKLKRLELLSARLGDVLGCLYLAAASVWRYQMEGEEGNTAMLPLARAAIRHQLALGAQLLRELHANLPSAGLRAISPLLLGGTPRPLGDRELLALADSLRENRALVDGLCPDLSRPASGGMLDLMKALELAKPVRDELTMLNKHLRRNRSLEAAAATSRDPAAALAYLQAADKVILVDDFAA
jgi:acyl-CoA dehydrogenase